MDEMFSYSRCGNVYDCAHSDLCHGGAEECIGYEPDYEKIRIRNEISDLAKKLKDPRFKL